MIGHAIVIACPIQELDNNPNPCFLTMAINEVKRVGIKSPTGKTKGRPLHVLANQIIGAVQSAQHGEREDRLNLTDNVAEMVAQFIIDTVDQLTKKGL